MKLRSLGILAGLAIIALTACNKTYLPVDNSIEGKYEGTITTEVLKSTTEVMPESTSATADVTKTGDGEIEIHCYSDELDTTFILNYYENHDSVMVCITDDDFEEMYGHMISGGHMMGGMMGDMLNGETEWMHHWNEEHEKGDQHFGGFDINNHSFSYTFNMMNGENPYYLKFNGIKQQ